MLKNFWYFISKSLFSGVSKKISATRISSYIILGSILTTTTVYLLIDVVNAIMLWKKDLIYTIPSEHVFIFGMILTHHLSLLGINKFAETKQSNKDSIHNTEKSEDAVDNTDNPKDENN